MLEAAVANRPPKRILHITARADVGGGPKNLFRLLSTYQGNSFEFFVASPNEQPFFDMYATVDGVVVEEISLRKIQFSTLLKLCRFVRKNKIEIVHSQGKGAGLWSRLLKIIFPRLCVVHHFRGIHYGGYNYLYRKLYFLYERVASKLTTKVIHVSSSEKLEALQLNLVHPDKQVVISNGVETRGVVRGKFDLRVRLNLPQEAFIIVSVVRYSTQKNIRMSLSIIAKLIQIRDDILFVIVGGEDNVSEECVRQWIEELKLRQHVLLAGEQMDVSSFMEAADLYLSTALWEGLPTSILEAMSCSLPVVASDVVGNRDVVSDENGALVSLDDEDKFVSTILNLSSQVDLCRSKGVTGKDLVERCYSIQAMVDAHVQLYTSLFPKSSSARI